MLQDFYNRTITVSRSATVNRKKTFSPVAELTDVQAHIQAITDTRREGGAMRTFREHLMMGDFEVKIGDKITDDQGINYEVIGVAAQDFRVGMRHYESTLKAV